MKIKKIKIIANYWLPVCLWAGFIFCMSSIPGDDIPPLFPYQDIFYHIAIYLIFAWLLMRAIGCSFAGMSPLRQIYAAILIGLIYALTDEFHQSFVPQRSASLMDLSKDGIGLFAGSIIYRWKRC